MTNYYECHITLIGEESTIRPKVEEIGWIFSCIRDDICLGEGIKCYATMHYSVSRYSFEKVVDLLEEFADQLRAQACNVIRTKVELVLYDSRQKDCRERIKL